MSTAMLLTFAVIVFGLMLAGLVLTMTEFLNMSRDPSKVKGVNVNAAPQQEPQHQGAG